MLQVTTPPDRAVMDAADSDALLIRQVQGRQQSAFRRLYERYLPQVYGLCLRLTGNRQLAEDATQEAFLQVWRHIDRFRGDSSFSTWVHSIAANSTISYLRKQKRWWQRLGDHGHFEAVAAELEDSPATDTAALLDLLPRLPERARLVFVLHGIEGYRQDQVARLMGTSTGTVKAQFHKASHQLRAWLEGKDGVDE
jgi:RNA polymerase sigma-70 factor (ECF subfamily)